jgi:hypothetical protein
MINWSKDMILYHGSYCSVPKPELSKCSPYKDFGLGFYLTTSKIQAERFVPSAVRKAIRLGTAEKETAFGIVTSYRFTLYNTLTLCEYLMADADWLHCVASHRKRSAFPFVRKELEKFDVIAGKIANDQTNATLTAYLAGLYGELGSAEADDTCIRRLLPERLENQICLRTPAALSALVYEGEEKIWLKNP